MPKRARVGLISSVLVIALVTLGAGFPTAKKVTPKRWASSVCNGLLDWADSIKSGAADLKSDLQGATDQAEIRDRLADYLAETVDATEELLQDLKEAGTPKTPKGKQATRVLKDAFEDARSGYRNLQSQSEKISVTDRAAAMGQYTLISEGADEVAQSLQSSLGDLSDHDPNGKLEKAFEASKACRRLTNA